MKLALFVILGLTQASVANVQKNAITCAACHGVNGVSNNPLWPNLSKQKKQYLMKQLQDFKTGRRQDPLMGPVAKTLSTKDIEELSLYFSEL